MIQRQSNVTTIDSLDILRAGIGVQLLFIAAVLFEAIGLDTVIVRPTIAVVYLAFVPGALALLALRVNCSVSSFTAYAIGLSLSLVMALGAVMSIVLPQIGIDRPLSPGLLTGAFALLTAGLALQVYRHGRRDVFKISTDDLFSPLPIALLLLPAVSILGTVLLDSTGNNVLLLGLLIVVSVVPLAFVLLGHAEQWGALAVWTVALSLLYHGGLWPFTGGHQLMQVTLDQGRWIPNYADGMGSLVSNGVLYPIFAILTDLPMSVEWGTVNPFLMSFIPLVLFEIFRRETSAKTAVLGCALFMFSFPFYTLYPNGGRIATPVLYLALVGLVIVDSRIKSPLQNVLALVFLSGVAVSHYGTAWVVMFGFGVSATVLYALRFLSSLKHGRESSLWSSVRQSYTDMSSKVLTPSAVGFYTVFALAWYLFTGLGGKFKTLPNHVVRGAEAVLFGEPFGGGAVRSATQEYGATAVTVSRWLYIAFGALMALGVVLVAWRRLVEDDRVVTDEYLALGAGFLSILGAAFLPFSTGFNTARVMMIVFTFTAPFTILGLNQLTSRIPRTTPSTQSDVRRSGQKLSMMAVGSLLMVFLLLNAGVASATVTGGYAPSNAVLQEQLRSSDDPIERSKAAACTSCIVQTHAWAFSKANPNQPLYGDDIAVAQVDYVRGQITEKVGRVPSGSRYQSLWSARNGTSESALLVVLPHNSDTEGVFVGQKYNWRAYGPLEDNFERANLVYAGPGSKIYWTAENHTSSARTAD